MRRPNDSSPKVCINAWFVTSPISDSRIRVSPTMRFVG